MAFLDVHDVVAGYLEGIDVLTGVSLAVERGSITGIIGANGAGKSTLLKTIFGFLHPRRGRIVLDGHDIQTLPPHAVKRHGVSYVAQGASVFPQLTVQENLDLGAWVFRHDRARMAAMLERAWWAFAESVRLLVAVEYQITRGDLGLMTPFLFGTPRPTPHYFLFLGLALAAILVAWQLVHSRVGVYLRAIRDDEEAAAVMGVDTFKWKRVVFAVSAVFAAVAGGFQGHYVGLLSPTPMKFNEIAIIVIMVIIGGLRTFWGPVVGAIFVEVLSEALRPWGETRMVLFALLVILVARAYPAGLVGLARALAGRWRVTR